MVDISMGIVLGPFGITEPTVESTTAPVGDGINDSIWLALCVKISRIRDWLDEAHNLLMILWLFPSVSFVESHPCLL
jgi:hypothetical protein